MTDELDGAIERAAQRKRDEAEQKKLKLAQQCESFKKAPTRLVGGEPLIPLDELAHSAMRCASEIKDFYSKTVAPKWAKIQRTEYATDYGLAKRKTTIDGCYTQAVSAEFDFKAYSALLVNFNPAEAERMFPGFVEHFYSVRSSLRSIKYEFQRALEEIAIAERNKADPLVIGTRTAAIQPPIPFVAQPPKSAGTKIDSSFDPFE